MTLRWWGGPPTRSTCSTMRLVGRMLGRLFDPDRASLLTRLVLDAVQRFDIELSRLRNDSTSVKFNGSHANADGRKRGGKPTPVFDWGHSQDQRQDREELAWSWPRPPTWRYPSLTGWQHQRRYHPHRRLRYALRTHRRRWLDVRIRLEACDLRQPAAHPLPCGRFLSVLPTSCREDRIFRDWVGTNTPACDEIDRLEPAMRRTRHDRRQGSGGPQHHAAAHQACGRSTSPTAVDLAGRHQPRSRHPNPPLRERWRTQTRPRAVENSAKPLATLLVGIP